MDEIRQIIGNALEVMVRQHHLRRLAGHRRQGAPIGLPLNVDILGAQIDRLAQQPQPLIFAAIRFARLPMPAGR